MSFRHFFQAAYWFSQPGVAYEGVRIISWGFFIAALVAGIVLFVLAHKAGNRLDKTVYNRYATWAASLAFMGLLWMFFRQEGIIFLGWRFWLAIGALGWGVWLYRLVNYSLKRVPQIRLEQEARAKKEKYLPK